MSPIIKLAACSLKSSIAAATVLAPPYYCKRSDRLVSLLNKTFYWAKLENGGLHHLLFPATKNYKC